MGYCWFWWYFIYKRMVTWSYNHCHLHHWICYRGSAEMCQIWVQWWHFLRPWVIFYLQLLLTYSCCFDILLLLHVYYLHTSVSTGTLLLLIAYYCFYCYTSAITGILQLPLSYYCYLWHTTASSGILLLIIAHYCSLYYTTTSTSILRLQLAYYCTVHMLQCIQVIFVYILHSQ